MSGGPARPQGNEGWRVLVGSCLSARRADAARTTGPGHRSSAMRSMVRADDAVVERCAPATPPLKRGGLDQPAPSRVNAMHWTHGPVYIRGFPRLDCVRSGGRRWVARRSVRGSVEEARQSDCLEVSGALRCASFLTLPPRRVALRAAWLVCSRRCSCRDDAGGARRTAAGPAGGDLARACLAPRTARAARRSISVTIARHHASGSFRTGAITTRPGRHT